MPRQLGIKKSAGIKAATETGDMKMKKTAQVSR
jgi:hypothetical protein